MKAIFLTSPQNAVVVITAVIAVGIALHATAWLLNRSK
jgi:hypothetical protein